jgi:hypothetical protein
LADADSIEQVWTNRSTVTLSLENASADTTFGIHDTGAALTVEIAGADEDTTVNLALDEAVNNVFTAAGAGTLAITGVNNASSIDLDLNDGFNDFTTITVAGDQDIDLGTLNEEVETLTITATGGVTATFDGIGVDKTVTGGAGDDDITLAVGGDDTVDLGNGDDRLTVVAGEINEDDSFEGGEGTDTLAVTGTTGADVFGVDVSEVVTGFEILEVTTDDDDTLDMDNITSVSRVTIINGGDNDTMDITNLTQAQATAGVTVELGATVNNGVVVDDEIALVSIALDDDEDDDSLNVTVVTNVDGNTSVVGDLTADDIETLTITATFDDEITDEDNQVLTITALGAEDAETINFAGNSNLTVTLVDAVDDQVISAATMTGSLDLTAALAVDYTITGSAGDDVFTMTANMNADDTVDGGEGDDTLELAASSTGGNVTLTLGTITNVEQTVVAITQDGAEAGGETITIVADGLASGTLVLVGAGDEDDFVDVTGIQAGVEVEIDGALDSTTELALDDFSGASDALTINLTQANNLLHQVADLTVSDVETITLAVTPDADNTIIDTVTITDLAINGTETLVVVSEENINITISASNALTAIDLSAAVEDVTLVVTDDTGITITLADATDTTNDVGITLAAGVGRDVIVFNAESVADVRITGFTVGAGITSDVLDLSEYGITSVAELTFASVNAGNDVTIDVADDDNFELITLVGVVNIGDVNTANFIFA